MCSDSAALAGINFSRASQFCQGAERAGRAQRRVSFAVSQLQQLHEVLDIDQCSRAELRVKSSREDMLSNLTFTHRSDGRDFPADGAEQQFVASAK